VRRSAALLLLPVCWSAGCSEAGETASHDNAAALAASPGAALADAFGPAISLAQDRSPAVFHGDFNGDGRADMVAFVRAERSHGAMPGDVQVLRPWSRSGEDLPGDLTPGADVMLAIVHGSTDTGSGAGFLLYDPESASILDAEAARKAFVVDRGGASGLDDELGRLARGDVLVIPTEAGIDTFLYWDGSTYRALQPLEYP
jgi:hypothetical protein